MNTNHFLRSMTAILSLAVAVDAKAQWIRSLPGMVREDGRSVSSAASVNDSGSVVAGETTGYEQFGATWTFGGGLYVLGSLGCSAAFWSRATGIDAQGAVIVGQTDSCEGGSRAFRWTSSSGMQSLGVLPSDSWAWSYATGVSADGLVVVGGSGSHAIRWTASEGMLDIGTLPNATYSRANATNADGSVIVGASGFSIGGQSAFRAFRWTASDGMGALQSLPGQDCSEASAVSRDGAVAVGASYVGGDFWATRRACRWYGDGHAEALEAPRGATTFGASGVSADGHLIIGSAEVEGATRAFVWIDKEGAKSLEAFLGSHGVSLAGWDSLDYANAISPSGRHIVGSGTIGGEQRGFLAAVGTFCAGNLDGNSSVDGEDLGTLLANWGGVPSSALARACDFDGDGLINGGDLGVLLANWGACPPSIWNTVIEFEPDPAVVTNSNLRSAIRATGLPWRVRDIETGIEMLLIPPGTFQMGCIMGSYTYGCNSWEQPVHQVTLTNAFYLGRYEVTQAQWIAKMGSNPSNFKAASDSASRPVEQVSWNAIQEYLAVTGLRFPTEAEWEYACRAGTQTAFYNGSSSDATLSALAWYGSNSGGQTHAVGGKAPNALGLYDMLGNVAEWVSDWYSTYTAASQTNPTGALTGSWRDIRGGRWNDGSSDVRSSARSSGTPVEVWSNVGFRVARNP